MASKTISVKEETYQRLNREKGTDESFSDVIDRLLQTDQHPLYSLVGLLNEDEIRTVHHRSDEFRTQVENRFDRNTTR